MSDAETREVTVFSGGEVESPLVAVAAEEARAVQEIQAALVIAKRFPRNEQKVWDQLQSACQRMHLAEEAEYEYPRGDGKVSGPSIRLAEAAARAWGNIRHGIQVLEESPSYAKVRAYAWDLETGNQHDMTFTVQKMRKARKKYVKLEDPRDVYEHVTNMGTRRLRTCLLRVLPSDLIEDAREWCNETLARELGDDLTETVRKLRQAFTEFDVTSEDLAQYLGHDLKAMSKGEVVKLRRVYAAIKDGYTTARKTFGRKPQPEETKESHGAPTAADVLSQERAPAPKDDADVGFKRVQAKILAANLGKRAENGTRKAARAIWAALLVTVGSASEASFVGFLEAANQEQVLAIKGVGPKTYDALCKMYRVATPLAEPKPEKSDDGAEAVDSDAAENVTEQIMTEAPGTQDAGAAPSELEFERVSPPEETEDGDYWVVAYVHAEAGKVFSIYRHKGTGELACHCPVWESGVECEHIALAKKRLEAK